MVLDLMHVHNFHGQTVNWVKMLLILDLIIVPLIIKKYILVLGKGPIQGLDDITIAAKAKHPTNFTRPGIRFCVKSAL